MNTLRSPLVLVKERRQETLWFEKLKYFRPKFGIDIFFVMFYNLSNIFFYNCW